MNPLAQELNEIIKETNQPVYDMLSEVGKNLFFPKGILSQGAEAKEKAHRFNATIGMATEKGRTMHLPSVMAKVSGLEPEEALTYASSFGDKPLRDAWKESILRKNPSLKGKSISLPVITNAITHGLSVISDMWVDPGNTIILPDKMWGNYNMIFTVRRGARIVHFPLFSKDGRFNLEGFEARVLEEAKENNKLILILNFPNNPTGYSITASEADDIATILSNVTNGGTNVIAVTDDAYFGLFYENDVFKESIFTRLLDKNERLLAIKLDAGTKEDYIWGLRVGFLTYGSCLGNGSAAFYEALERKTAGAVRGSISNASHLSQTILLKSLQSEGYDAEKQEKFEIMKERALEVKRVLADSKYDEAWVPYPFNSGYFMCLMLKTVEAETLRVHLLEKYGIGLIALGERDLRVAFSCIEKEDVQELFNTLLQGVKDLES